MKTHGTYGASLLNPKWKAKRKQILERDGNKCVNCDSTDNLEVHHKQYHFVKRLNNYKEPWDYPDDLLVTLCRKCNSRGRNQYVIPVKMI